MVNFRAQNWQTEEPLNEKSKEKLQPNLLLPLAIATVIMDDLCSLCT